MHPAHLLAIKQRVLTSDVEKLEPMVDRMRRNDDQHKLAMLLDKLND